MLFGRNGLFVLIPQMITVCIGEGKKHHFIGPGELLAQIFEILLHDFPLGMPVKRTGGGDDGQLKLLYHAFDMLFFQIEKRADDG